MLRKLYLYLVYVVISSYSLNYINNPLNYYDYVVRFRFFGSQVDCQTFVCYNVIGEECMKKRIVLHIDVNNAFLSWTACDMLRKGSKVDVRDKVAVIGGDETKRRGVVLAKSTPAKKYGIQTAEPIASARRKYKDLLVLKPNHLLYNEQSNKLYALLCKYFATIERFSIDECYVEYTEVENLLGDPIAFAYKLQKEIYDTFGYTVNIGIANNKLCAKMASDFEKPNKVHTLFEEEIKEKMWPLPIEDLYMVGKRSSVKLREIGIKTIGDLAHCNPTTLKRYFKNQSIEMIHSANGIDHSIVDNSNDSPKGVGNTITLPYDLEERGEVYQVLQDLSTTVGYRLRKHKKYATVVNVLYKTNLFTQTSHQLKLKNSINTDDEIYKISVQLFNELWNGEPIRLLGIRLADLIDTKIEQISLFDNNISVDSKTNENLQKTIDQLKEKYGTKAVTKAATKNSILKDD